MTKRKRSRPTKPRTIDPGPVKTPDPDGLNLAALQLPANNDVKAEGATRKHVERARRLDVFQLFLDRGAVPEEHVTAVRALELLIHAAAGAGGTTEPHEYVSGSGCAEMVTQRMIEASGQAIAILNYMPIRHAALAGDLLSPIKRDNTITRWRDAVQRHTGTTEKNAQGDVIRWLCCAVYEAIGDLGYAERRRA